MTRADLPNISRQSVVEKTFIAFYG